MSSIYSVVCMCEAMGETLRLFIFKCFEVRSYSYVQVDGSFSWC
nr:MAG TPA: hypothetical protein [Caudoviricetes sp.]